MGVVLFLCEEKLKKREKLNKIETVKLKV